MSGAGPAWRMHAARCAEVAKYLHMRRSGLRGAVGLSLSLFVLLDNQIADVRYRTLSLFFMGCVAFLTTLVQGTTMGPFLQVRHC